MKIYFITIFNSLLSLAVHMEPQSIVATQMRLAFSHTVLWLSGNTIGRKGTCHVSVHFHFSDSLLYNILTILSPSYILFLPSCILYFHLSIFLFSLSLPTNFQFLQDKYTAITYNLDFSFLQILIF